MTKKIPVIFHDLRGNDSHLIIKELSKFDVKVSVIPNGLEKYMALTINKNLVFIDSMQFMNSGLNSLVKNLSDNDFKYLSEEFCGEFLELVKQKAVYPYKYMNSFKRFSENKLPDRCKFFGSLKDKCVSEKDYLKANNIWNMFRMNTVGDYGMMGEVSDDGRSISRNVASLNILVHDVINLLYHDLYLKKVVLLLADVFEKFINMCLDYYGLHPCHYFSCSVLSWDAMLKMTGIELELMSDIDMHLSIEKEMRGGISYIAKRYSKANNNYMKCYDSSKESKYITYLGANNLYGWAMS